jgi:hypothetical protein
MPETPSDDLAKEVFAHFGAAYYQAEVLHRGLCNLFVWMRIAAIGPMNRYRVEEHLAKAFNTTLGQLLGEIRNSFSGDDLQTLDVAVTKRNFLAHHFWFERVHLMGSDSGCRTMLAELNAAEELFRIADGLVDGVAAPYLAKMSVKPEVMAEALESAMRGEPPEALRSQRKLKKRESIVRAYDVPGEGGAVSVFFETDDGAIWQLCDVGLGWTRSDAADPSWPPSILNKFLPATIDPRPHFDSPWHYDIELSGAQRRVRPGKPSGPFSLSVRRKK